MTIARSDQSQLFFRLCSDHLSIEAIPKKPVRIDLESIRHGSVSDHEVMMWTPHFAVLKNQNGQEITVRRDGRMVVRKAPTELAARDAAVFLIRNLSKT